MIKKNGAGDSGRKSGGKKKKPYAKPTMAVHGNLYATQADAASVFAAYGT